MPKKMSKGSKSKVASAKKPAAPKAVSKAGASAAVSSKAGASTAVSSKAAVSKSAFIRSIPSSTPANDVVAIAADQGIKINAGLVYAVRSADKNSGGAPKGKPGRPRKAGATPASQPNTRGIPASQAGDLRHQFVSIAVRIGTDEAQRLLDNLVDVQTQIGQALK